MTVNITRVEALVIKGILEQLMDSKEFHTEFSQIERIRIIDMFRRMQIILQEYPQRKVYMEDIVVDSSFNFPEWLQEQMEQRHWNSTDIARATGVAQRTIAMYLKEKTLPTMYTLIILMKALGKRIVIEDDNHGREINLYQDRQEHC